MTPDPSLFGGPTWGILGILAFVVVILVLILWKMFLTASADARAREKEAADGRKIIMDFVDAHRGETNEAMTKALTELAATLAASQDRHSAAVATSVAEIVSGLRRHTRSIDELVMTSRMIDLLEKARARGLNMTPEEVDRIVRIAAQERLSRGDA